MSTVTTSSCFVIRMFPCSVTFLMWWTEHALFWSASACRPVAKYVHQSTSSHSEPITLQADKWFQYYGVHLGSVKVPLEEWFPRYDDGGYNFYFPQEDRLKELQARRKTWSYNIIRPNAIVGYSPQGM